ncbi:MAG TPA: hypothetical protein VE914_09220, partial [Candidatus Angelobacter sp.]|nr:hypothetical protein [Candidatus Angelobacter sp.]
PKSETADDAVDGGEDDAHQRAGQDPIDEMQRQVDARLADQPGRPGQGRAALGERRQRAEDERRPYQCADRRPERAGKLLGCCAAALLR